MKKKFNLLLLLNFIKFIHISHLRIPTDLELLRQSVFNLKYVHFYRILIFLRQLHLAFSKFLPRFWIRALLVDVNVAIYTITFLIFIHFLLKNFLLIFLILKKSATCDWRSFHLKWLASSFTCFPELFC